METSVTVNPTPFKLKSSAVAADSLSMPPILTWTRNRRALIRGIPALAEFLTTYSAPTAIMARILGYLSIASYCTVSMTCQSDEAGSLEHRFRIGLTQQLEAGRPAFKCLPRVVLGSRRSGSATTVSTAYVS